MKIVSKSKANNFNNSEVCFGKEYSLGDKDINGAVIEVKGRYPDKGRVVNEECKELVYVLEGEGKLVVEGKETSFKSGDMILLFPNEKYFWEADCEILTVCNPAFYSEQHKEVS